jgi:RNA polymerase sigma factor (sigma-70 family)
VCGDGDLDERARYLWIASHVLPLEAEVRGWLRKHVHTLSDTDADDLLQESYARLWGMDLSKIDSARGYLYTVVRNLLAERARRARIVPMERLGEIEALRIPSEEPGPEGRVSARQELERLQRILEALPERARQAYRAEARRAPAGCAGAGHGPRLHDPCRNPPGLVAGLLRQRSRVECHSQHRVLHHPLDPRHLNREFHQPDGGCPRRGSALRPDL